MHTTRAYSNDDLFNAVVFCYLLDGGDIKGLKKVRRNCNKKAKKSVEAGDLIERVIGTCKVQKNRTTLNWFVQRAKVDLYSPAMKYSYASMYKMLLGVFGGYSLKAILPDITNGFNWSYLAEYCDLENRFGFLTPKRTQN